jgi:hypothetical protein
MPLIAANTTVTQQITGPDGSLVGTVLIKLSAACQSGSALVGQEIIRQNFLGGALSGGSTTTSYSVNFQARAGWDAEADGIPSDIKRGDSQD